jgi:hypothetical protein
MRVVQAMAFACALLGFGLPTAEAYHCHPGYYFQGRCYPYRHHGHYYRYKHDGRYYLHRSYRHGHWRYY